MREAGGAPPPDEGAAPRTRGAEGTTPLTLERIGVVARRHYEGISPVLERLVALTDARGIELRYDADTLPHAPEGSRPLELERESADLVVALGGDGTLLRASRIVSGHDVPIMGVNVGHLGFLTAAREDELEPALRRLEEGAFELDRRFTLRATVVSERGEAVATDLTALNDFVVHKAGVARVTRLDLSVGRAGQEDEIGSFSADGVIIATPTGSTAYSMAAGGPIIVPSVDCIVVTAICPHTLAVRPLVVPADAHIRLRALDRPGDLVLSVDGQEGRMLEEGDEVLVERGDLTISLVRFPGQTFFTTMRRKLNWAIRTGDAD